jgi:hypothetical protein
MMFARTGLALALDSPSEQHAAPAALSHLLVHVRRPKRAMRMVAGVACCELSLVDGRLIGAPTRAGPRAVTDAGAP